jgi:hypothetical protein
MLFIYNCYIYILLISFLLLKVDCFYQRGNTVTRTKYKVLWSKGFGNNDNKSKKNDDNEKNNQKEGNNGNKKDEDMLLQIIAEKEAEFQAELDKAKAALALVQADAANLVKNKATIDKWKEAIKAWEKAIAGSGATTYQRALTRQTTYRGQALAQYTNAQRDVKDGLAMTELICSKGY